MEKRIVTTADGSHTITVPERNVAYHSLYGAVQESVHVFIEAGLQNVFELFPNEQITVFEMGFGTGLNAFLTAQQAAKRQRDVHYTAVELFPLTNTEAEKLNYGEILNDALLFQQLQACAWNRDVKLTQHFTLHKQQQDLLRYATDRFFHLIYYDAFAPAAQPELWTETVFKKMRSLLKANGVLVTYCAKGDVRRALQAAGFYVEKLPGPPRKREMIRAVAVPVL